MKHCWLLAVSSLALLMGWCAPLLAQTKLNREQPLPRSSPAVSQTFPGSQQPEPAVDLLGNPAPPVALPAGANQNSREVPSHTPVLPAAALAAKPPPMGTLAPDHRDTAAAGTVGPLVLPAVQARLGNPVQMTEPLPTAAPRPLAASPPQGKTPTTKTPAAAAAQPELVAPPTPVPSPKDVPTAKPSTAAQAEKIPAPKVVGKAAPKEQVLVSIGNLFTIGDTTPDMLKKYPTVKLTGFFHADYGTFYQSPLNREQLGDIQDGMGFRRARLAGTGAAWDNVTYMVEMDFATPGRPSFLDVWLDVANLPWLGHVRVGHWRQPFSMDALTSVRELTFLERSLPFQAFDPFRQIGIGFYNMAKNERATWAASVYRFPTDFYGNNVGDWGGYSGSGRVTYLPYYMEGCYLLHVGAAYAYLNPSYQRTRFASIPEFSIGQSQNVIPTPAGFLEATPLFANTGFLENVININELNFELAGEYGPFYFQSEAFFTTVDRINQPLLNFWGAYYQAACILTGEVRPYNRASGIFGRIRPRRNFHPCHGIGAIEAAGRISYLDLTSANIRGGQMASMTLGLNWYLNTFTKFQFNYILPYLWDRTVGIPAGLPQFPSNADIFAFRAQVDF